MIPYGRQDISQDDIDAVLDVLKSDFLTQGPAAPAFEKALADYCGARHALVLNSATSALHVACLALGLGEGDILWTSPNSFVASANCARYCGADVDFVDIDPATGNMCADALEQKLEVAQTQGRLPKIVMPVHFAGQPCDMVRIAALAATYHFKIIEDAAHAVGAHDGAAKTGACRFSDITIFSFHPVKLITSGEGGAALTNDEQLASRMALLRSHGVTRDAGQMMAPQPEQPWYYEQVDLGLNYRMTDIQAALGASQLQRLDGFISRRTALAQRYDKLLQDLGVTPLVWQPEKGRSALHLYVIKLDDVAKRKRAQIFAQMRAAGIGVNVHYIPIHTQPYYQNLGFKKGDFPQAIDYYARAITLPLFPNLTEAQQDEVVDVLSTSLGA